MVRPKDEPLIRLSRRIWIRALRTGVDGIAAESIASEEKTWNTLGRQLLHFSAYPQYADLRFKGLRGVVDDGNDPRRMVRRIDVLDTDGITPNDAGVVIRRPTRRASSDQDRTKSYLEFPVDLVECGKNLCPGSEQWESAYLWRLSMPELPRLEELRMVISRLTTRLEMHTPSLDEYRPFLPAAEFSQLEQLTDIQIESRYRQSLEPFIRAKSADAMSLLAALVAESLLPIKN